MAEATLARGFGECRFGRDIRAISWPWEDLALGMCMRSWGGHWLGRVETCSALLDGAQGEGPKKAAGGWGRGRRGLGALAQASCGAAITALVSEAHHRPRCAFRLKAFDKSQLSRRGAFPSLPTPTTAHPFSLDQIYTRRYF